jgi:peroxiredoxin
MKKLYWLLILPLLSFITLPKAEKVQLKGKMQFADPAEMVFLTYRVGDDQVSDSVQIKNGKFEYNAKLTEPTLAILTVRFKPSGEKARPRTERMPLFLEPGKIKLVVNDSLKFAKVTGSASQTAFEEFNKLQEPYLAKSNKLNEEYRAYKKENNEEGMKKVVDESSMLSEDKKENLFYPYLKEHPESPIALYVLNLYAGYDIDVKKVEPIFESLAERSRQLPSGIAFKERIEIAKKTGVGVYAMNFTQNDTLGNAVSLASFKGKYVLLDFWASWCGPCRVENPNVVKAFNKYRNKGFTILSVSLDQPGKKQAWLDAIHKDGLAWTHVSDLKYWDNVVAKQYGIRAIPQNFLLDPSGKIIAKNLRGEELNQKLDELFPD